MKKRLKYLILVLCAIITFPFVACTPDGGDVTKPETMGSVIFITVFANGAVVGGTLTKDLSENGVTLTADVQTTDDSVDDTVTFASSKPAVAEVTASGTVTFVSKGEAVISASAGNKKYEFVLVLGNDYTSAPQYGITVNDGTASATSAYVGSYITLTAVIPQHKSFVKWEYTYTASGERASDIWINGNLFAMPAAGITATAVFEDMLYTLNVVGAAVTHVGDQPYDKEGEDGGNSKGGSDPIYDVAVYHFAYETDISVEAIEEPSGMMFIGWDFGTKNNRRGEAGETSFGPFEMPGEEMTVWAIFSPKNNKVYTAGNAGDYYSNASRGAKLITNGAPAGEAVDPDLDGGCGYRFTIPGDAPADGGWPENIADFSQFSTMQTGSQTLRAVLKNHHASLSVTVETYATFIGNITTSGHITIGPGETVVKYFAAGLGFHTPWWGFTVREAVGGSSSTTVLLDVTLQSAPTYPEGDKLLEISGSAQWVWLNGDDSALRTFTSVGGWSNEMRINNKIGLSLVAVWAQNVNLNAYLRASISNMPAYNASSPTTTVYVRLINNIDKAATFKFNIGTDTNPLSGSAGASLASFPRAGEGDSDKGDGFTLGEYETKIFAITVPRTSGAQPTFYFSIIKCFKDFNSGGTGQHISMQMAYNNVFGYEEA